VIQQIGPVRETHAFDSMASRWQLDADVILKTMVKRKRWMQKGLLRQELVPWFLLDGNPEMADNPLTISKRTVQMQKVFWMWKT
jgi:hypothetical protein